MPAFFWNSARAAFVSVPKFLVTPWALSFRAAGPTFWEMRNSWSCLTSLPVIPMERLRVKTKRVEVEAGLDWPACLSSAASWAWRAASSAVNEAVDEVENKVGIGVVVKDGGTEGGGIE